MGHMHLTAWLLLSPALPQLRRSCMALSSASRTQPQVRAGRKTRYAYLAEMDPEQTQKRGVPVMPGLVKLDLSLPGDEAVVGRIVHGDNTFGGEAFFVPAHEDPSQCQSALAHSCLAESWLCSRL